MSFNIPAVSRRSNWITSFIEKGDDSEDSDLERHVSDDARSSSVEKNFLEENMTFSFKC